MPPWSLEDLPKKVILEIFSYLSMRDLGRFKRTSKRFRYLLRNFVIEGVACQPPSSLRRLQATPQLQTSLGTYISNTLCFIFVCNLYGFFFQFVFEYIFPFIHIPPLISRNIFLHGSKLSDLVFGLRSHLGFSLTNFENSSSILLLSID